MTPTGADRGKSARTTEDGTYLTNDSGDVWGKSTAGGAVELDPASWGWRAPQSVDPPEDRRTLDEIQAMPDFTVVVATGDRWVPGPRPLRSMAFTDGRAAPASVESARGTLAYFDRLTDALGSVVKDASTNPGRCPFAIHDYVGGRRIAVTYTPPPLAPGGQGRVYFVTDGDGMKVGFTVKTVASRIAGLQTGNPRTIRPVVTVHGVGIEVELALHSAFAEHHRTGEWFRLDALQALARHAGGWPQLVALTLGPGPWQVQVH